MKIEIDVKKSIEENAAKYYEKAKKSRRKIQGAEGAYSKTVEKLKFVGQEKPQPERKLKKVIQKKRQWFEKFRWFVSSEGILCIGGRDATTNDIIVKKHLDEGDLVFHTQIAGSPFFVIKAEGKEIGEKTINETAQATASYSRAWKQGFTATEVYYVSPDQIKKEFGLPKGSFMIHGKRAYLTPELVVAVGVTEEGQVIGAPVDAVSSKTSKYAVLVQGDMKSSDVAKKIKSKLGGDLEDIQGFLPPGNSKLLKFHGV